MSFLLILVPLVFLGLFYGVYRYWKAGVEGEIVEGAAYEYERLSRQDPDLIKGLDEKSFVGFYRTVEMPRLPGYVLAIFVTFIIGTPLMLVALSAGDWAMNHFDMIPQPNDVVTRFLLEEDGTARLVKDVSPEALQYYVRDLGGFYYFFGMLGFWVAIVWLFMYRYHSRAPGLLREEILRGR